MKLFQILMVFILIFNLLVLKSSSISTVLIFLKVLWSIFPWVLTCCLLWTFGWSVLLQAFHNGMNKAFNSSAFNAGYPAIVPAALFSNFFFRNYCICNYIFSFIFGDEFYVIKIRALKLAVLCLSIQTILWMESGSSLFLPVFGPIYKWLIFLIAVLLLSQSVSAQQMLL